MSRNFSTSVTALAANSGSHDLVDDLELFYETWNKFKLHLHEGKCSGLEIQSLFVLQLQSCIFNNFKNSLNLPVAELRNFDNLLARFEDHCLTRILLKFERFKSFLAFQGMYPGSGSFHESKTTSFDLKMQNNSFSPGYNSVHKNKTNNVDLKMQNNSLSPGNGSFHDNKTTSFDLKMQNNSLSPGNGSLHENKTTSFDLKMQNNSFSPGNGSFHENKTSFDLKMQNNSFSKVDDGSSCHKFVKQNADDDKKILLNRTQKNSSDDVSANSDISGNSNQKNGTFVVASVAPCCDNSQSQNDISVALFSERTANVFSEEGEVEMLIEDVKTQIVGEFINAAGVDNHKIVNEESSTSLTGTYTEIKSDDTSVIINDLNPNQNYFDDSAINSGNTENLPHRRILREQATEIYGPVYKCKLEKTREIKRHTKSHTQKNEAGYPIYKPRSKRRDPLKRQRRALISGKNNVAAQKVSDISNSKPCRTTTFLTVQHSDQDSVSFCSQSVRHRTNTNSQFGNCKAKTNSQSGRCKTKTDDQSSSCKTNTKSSSNHDKKPCSTIPVKDKQLKCEVCLMTFKEQSKLSRHTLSHTREKPFICKTCGSRFADKSHLNVHLRVHSGEKPFKCDICQSSFSESMKLKNHKRIHTGEKPYVCEVCGSAFSVLSSLRSHMKVHSGDKPYKCDSCDFACAHSSNLKAHLLVHTGERKFTCEVCSACFTETAKLKRHIMVHTGEKPYSCEVCGSRFSDKSHLTVHMRIHSGDKPFKCTYCSSAFVESSKLKNHLRTHTGEKPYVCEVCGMCFAVSYSLKSHLRRHTGEKPYKCEICGYATSQSSNLKAHMAVHNGNKIHICKECNASFSEASKLNQHRAIHAEPQEETVNCDPTSKRIHQHPQQLSHVGSQQDSRGWQEAGGLCYNSTPSLDQIGNQYSNFGTEDQEKSHFTETRCEDSKAVEFQFGDDVMVPLPDDLPGEQCQRADLAPICQTGMLNLNHTNHILMDADLANFSSVYRDENILDTVPHMILGSL